jgi:hypothetical protein
MCSVTVFQMLKVHTLRVGANEHRSSGAVDRLEPFLLTRLFYTRLQADMTSMHNRQVYIQL